MNTSNFLSQEKCKTYIEPKWYKHKAKLCLDGLHSCVLFRSGTCIKRKPNFPLLAYIYYHLFFWHFLMLSSFAKNRLENSNLKEAKYCKT